VSYIGGIGFIFPNSGKGCSEGTEALTFMDVDSIISIDIIHSWINKCGQEHKCLPNVLSYPNTLQKAPLMTLTDVTKDCLVQVGYSVPYVTLSYVWGRKENAFTATTANIEDLFQYGSLVRHEGVIPRTIRDAMLLTKNLGLQYL
jgi:heterokaryon incompatibility protein (HET)